ncbi:TetR family transcriptional regulator [Paractinoplanes ferrugineus]|uniref:TetR family transcriptional regulator n=1 Tax=Paractinoplanes ferrugineus TaxID=113564 RepID=A0A919MH18_9ACTN|nr:TetR family transcriptional regulator [Actinoplanes ferrugineus]GIE15378.1 TetR family transcriptional regulator [Actinoplanes ferrugineus]
MGLREQKKVATRAALGWAAVRLIVERGYDKVLVEDIAAEAGVSPRTFNNYFGSKAEAVASRHLDRCMHIAEALRARPAGEPLWDAITAAVLEQLIPGPEVTSQPRPDREVWAAGLELMLTVPAIQAESLRAAARAESTLAAAVAERTGTDAATDMYPNLVAATVLAAHNVANHSHYSLFSGKSDILALTTEALRQVSSGLPPPS